jgi:O-antigen ligase
MTVLTTRASAGPAGTRRGSELVTLLRAHASLAAVVLASAWWLIEVTRSWAGRDAPSVTVGAILVALALVLVRPDRVLPRSALVLAAAISIGAFVVPLTADSGWAGAPDGAIYTCGVWLAIVVAAAVVNRADTMTWFLTLVAASAPIQFMSGWLGWWGGDDPSRPMVGTFYWHNPYAAFLIPGGLVGLLLWAWRDRLFALLGLVSFTFASVGVVYSTSRAGLATYVLGVVLVGVAAAVRPERWRALRQIGIAAVVAAAGAFFISGPPFFSHRASPLAAEHRRAATQHLGANTGQRLDFWHQALIVFRHHPITGGGYKSLVAQAIGHAPSDLPLSPYAHNGYLQALGEGGLVLGVPFLLAVIIVAVIVVRSLVRGLVVRRDLPIETVVLAIALGCVMLHSGVDFDWTYAASFAMAGVLAGLVVGDRLRDRPPDQPAATASETDKPSGTARYALAGCVLAGVALLGVSGWVMRHGNHTVNIRLSQSALSQEVTVSSR